MMNSYFNLPVPDFHSFANKNCVRVNTKLVVPYFKVVSRHFPILEVLLIKIELRSVIGSTLSFLEQLIENINKNKVVRNLYNLISIISKIN